MARSCWATFENIKFSFNFKRNMIDYGHFALSLESEHKPVSLYGDGRCSSYLTGIRKTSDASNKDLGVIHCDVEAIVK